MLKRLLAFFEPEIVAQKPEHSVELATAALLFEVIRADNSVAAVERESFRQQLQNHVTLTAEEFDALLEEGEQTSEAAVDLVQFTSKLNGAFDMPQKIEVLESLWHIALADDVLDSHEEHIIRRIADLMHIPHSQFIQAKLRVTEKP